MKEYDKYSKYDNSIVDLSAVYMGSFFTVLVIFIGMYLLAINTSLGIVYSQKVKVTFNILPIFFNYLVAINLTTFFMYGYDKLKAMTGWGMRIPEKVLHILVTLGGSVGGLFAMGIFGHKISKISFYKITWMIIVIQLTLLLFPHILSLPGETQLIIWLAVPLILAMLYFIDEVIALLSTAFTIVMIIGGIVFAYFFYSSISSKYTQAMTNTSVKQKRNSVTEKCKYYYTTTDRLNMRLEPNQNSKKIGTLNRHEKVCVTNEMSSWLYIKNKGWVYNKYLTTEKSKMLVVIKGKI